MASGDAERALSLAEQALALSQREARFHDLAGDARASLGQYAAAERDYSRALALDSSWFYPFLRRGMVREALGHMEAAGVDLRASLARLETADGHYHLGNVERALGRVEVAIRHYRMAAQSESSSGQRARQALRELGAE